MEDKVRAAIIEEFQRQAKGDGTLSVRVLDDGVDVGGNSGLDALVMVVIGAFAGGSKVFASRRGRHWRSGRSH